MKFWKTRKLSQMTSEEWESLCDRCGRCCLCKVEYDDGEILYTNVACKLMNPDTGMCSNYSKRKKKVPDCIQLTWRNVGRIRYLPHTCAYRLLAEGKPLPKWHPLISGTQNTVSDRGISVAGKTILFESEDIDLDEYVVDWIPACKPRAALKKR